MKNVFMESKEKIVMETFVVYYYEINEFIGLSYKSIEMQALTLTKCYTLAKRLFGSRVVGVVTKDFDRQFIKGDL